jgi:hypothetical protein
VNAVIVDDAADVLAFRSGSAELHRRRFRFDRCGACWRRVDRRAGKHYGRCRNSGRAAVMNRAVRPAFAYAKH